ncbi:MAG: dihydrolipoyl dehydrogenase [Albidovulum sp.]|nr:dihydrolipoyl dehydrogenase [Albidovulum sp.]
MSDYDIVVVGGGPGGYVCAIRAAQLGLRAACVEGRSTLGGTCLNVGCIPSKALLHASHMYHESRQNFEKMGLKPGAKSFDWKQMLAYKDGAINDNTRGIEFLFKKNKVDWIKGWARVRSAGKVAVGDRVVETRDIVVATGSEPTPLRGVEVDEQVIVTSTGALALSNIPKSIVVIGAGVIGLELGSVFARLGSEVTVLEYLEHALPEMDGEISKNARRFLASQGLKFKMGAEVLSVERKGNKAEVKFKLRKDGSEHDMAASTVLVATGRRPVVGGFGLEEAGIEFAENGAIKTDSRLSTNVKGIWAIGDATEGPMLAHKAEDEGIAAAELIAGNAGHVNYQVIPSVVYTHPEVAMVGCTEEQLKQEGKDYVSGKFSFMGNGRAKAVFASSGFVKILADKNTDRVLGCHVIGPSAGELIHEICVAMEFGAAAEDLALTCHAHPTFSEAMREAALACGDGAIHA